jgi:hypothetical protein
MAAKEDSNPMFNMSTFAHEMKHAYQYFKGILGFAFDENGKQIDTSDSKPLEREAGVRGSLYSGSTMLNNSRIGTHKNIYPSFYQLNSHYDNYQDATSTQKGWINYWKTIHDNLAKTIFN